jgi:FAD/FMN-containing dehydrogenase
MSDLKRVAKANEGYDLKQLFIGAEGTLGIVTRAVLRLEPAAVLRETALVAFGDAARAVALFASLRRSTAVRLRAAEIMWRDYALAAAAELRLDALTRFAAGAAVCAIFEVDGNGGARDAFEAALAAAAQDGLVADALLARSGRESADIWKVREDSWTIERVMPHGLWYDVSVPLGMLDAYVARLRTGVEALGADLRVYAFGHLGDGNLHLTISNGTDIAPLYGPVGEIVYAGLAEAGGSFSAEHGIGLEKRAALARHASPERLDLMRRIKSAFDPHGIMNPGKILMP